MWSWIIGLGIPDFRRIVIPSSSRDTSSQTAWSFKRKQNSLLKRWDPLTQRHSTTSPTRKLTAELYCWFVTTWRRWISACLTLQWHGSAYLMHRLPDILNNKSGKQNRQGLALMRTVPSGSSDSYIAYCAGCCSRWRQKSIRQMHGFYHWR